MCGYSKTAGHRTRDARRGDQLIATAAPHAGFSSAAFNWLTEPGDPNTAVCMLTGTKFTVQVRDEPIRGAEFLATDEEESWKPDYVIYLDGDKERVSLNSLPFGTKITVLQLPVENVEAHGGEGDGEVGETDLAADIAATAGR